jgi:hypothetical protein
VAAQLLLARSDARQDALLLAGTRDSRRGLAFRAHKGLIRVLREGGGAVALRLRARVLHLELPHVLRGVADDGQRLVERVPRQLGLQLRRVRLFARGLAACSLARRLQPRARKTGLEQQRRCSRSRVRTRRRRQ